MSNKYEVILTGFSDVFKGVFKEELPPKKKEDVLMEIQAIAWKQDDDAIKGDILIAYIGQDFGDEPFDISLYEEKRNPPYRTIGYTAKRVLKNVRVETQLKAGEHKEEFLSFTAEEDTGWQDMEFVF